MPFCNIYIHSVKVDVRLLVGFLEDLNTCHPSVRIDRQAYRDWIKFYHIAAAALLKGGLDWSSMTTCGRSECNASRRQRMMNLYWLFSSEMKRTHTLFLVMRLRVLGKWANDETSTYQLRLRVTSSGVLSYWQERDIPERSSLNSSDILWPLSFTFFVIGIITICRGASVEVAMHCVVCFPFAMRMAHFPVVAHTLPRQMRYTPSNIAFKVWGMRCDGESLYCFFIYCFS